MITDPSIKELISNIDKDERIINIISSVFSTMKQKVISLKDEVKGVIRKDSEELKNKLRDELKNELREISGVTDAPSANTKKKASAGDLVSPNTDAHPAEKIDYFELVYECIHTRKNFLNIISLNSRTAAEPDIDLVILQALLNGKL